MTMMCGDSLATTTLESEMTKFLPAVAIAALMMLTFPAFAAQDAGSPGEYHPLVIRREPVSREPPGERCRRSDEGRPHQRRARPAPCPRHSPQRPSSLTLDDRLFHRRKLLHRSKSFARRSAWVAPQKRFRNLVTAPSVSPAYRVNKSVIC